MNKIIINEAPLTSKKASNEIKKELDLQKIM